MNLEVSQEDAAVLNAIRQVRGFGRVVVMRPAQGLKMAKEVERSAR